MQINLITAPSPRKKFKAPLIEINWYEERKLSTLEERKWDPSVTDCLSKKKKLKPPFSKHWNWRDNVPI